MYTFVFDCINAYGPIPNLIKNPALKPYTDAWWDLATAWPYSDEFRFLKYLRQEGILYRIYQTDELPSTAAAIYPINLNIFSNQIDYFALVSAAALELCRQHRIRIVFFYSEGDDPADIIDDHITYLCDRYRIPHSQVKFVIANYQQHTDRYCYFPDDEIYYRYLNRSSEYVKQVNLRQRDKKFTCLTRMDKDFRKIFSALLWEAGITKDSYFSYTAQTYDIAAADNTEYKWTRYFPAIEQIVKEFETGIPYRCDDLTDAEHNDHKLINRDFFENSYWHIVLESFIGERTVFLTEKTFKPILNLQPFVILGPPGSLALLHQFGYQTFNKWVDESYDDEHQQEARVYKLYTQVKKLAAMTHSELQTMTEEMQAVLLHNQQVFLSSKHEKLHKLLKTLYK